MTQSVNNQSKRATLRASRLVMETVRKPDVIEWMDDVEGEIETHAFGEGACHASSANA